MHFYVILKSLPISDDRGPSSFEGTSTVLRLKFMYVSSFDSINIRTPICQEGQSERTFPIFAYSSWFFLLFSWFSWFFPLSQFLANFLLSGVALRPPCVLSGYATAHTPLLVRRPLKRGYVYTWKVCNYATGDVCIVNMQWQIYPQFAGDTQVVCPQLHSWELFRGKRSMFVTYANGDKNPRSNTNSSGF